MSMHYFYINNYNDKDLLLNYGYSQSYDFSSSHVQMWELDHKEGWVLKNWCFRTVALEKILESPLDSKEIKPVNPKGNQLWILTGRTNAKAESPVLWLPDAKSWLIGKLRCWERLKAKGEGGNRGWDGWRHHQLNGHVFEQTLGYSGGQRSLACYSPWGRKACPCQQSLSLSLRG